MTELMFDPNATLCDSEAKYHTLFEAIDQSFCLCEMLFDQQGEPIDYRILEVNSSFARITGLQNAIGKTARELVPNLEARWFETYGRVVRTGESVRFEDQSIAMNCWFDVNAIPVGEPQSHQFALLFTDITDRKRREANLAFLATVSQALIETTRADEIVQAVGAELNRHLQVSICAFAEINERADEVIIKHDWYRDASPSLIGVYSLPEFVTTEVRQTAQTGQPIVIRNYATDPRVIAPSRYTALGIGAEINIPLIRDGAWKFSLVVFHRQPYDWRNDEIELMQELASRIWTKLERTRTETALSENRAELEQQVQKFDVTLSTIADYVFSFDRNGRFLYVNQTLLDLWGVSAAEAIGKTMADLNYPTAVEQQVLKDMRRVFETGETLRNETAYISPAGVEGYFEYILSPIVAADGTVESVVGSSRNISDRKRVEDERKRVEQALRESEEQSRQILESITDAFFAVDQNWRFTYVNQTAYTLVNRTPGDLIGKDFWEEFPGANNSKFEQMHRRVMRDRVPELITEFYPDHDRWYEVRSYPAVNGITMYFRNVTDQVQTEAALRTSEEYFRQLSDAVPQLVWTAQPDGKVDYLNRQWLDYTGIPPQVFYEWGWQQIVHPDDLPNTLTVWTEALQSGEPIEIKHRFRRVDGQWRWQLVRGALFKNEAGQVTKWFGTCTDIHESEMRQQDAQFLEELGDHLRTSEDADNVMGMVAYLLGQYLETTRCFFAEVNETADWWTASHDYKSAAELPAIAGNYPLSTYPLNIITAFRAGRAVNVTDTMADPMTAAFYAMSYQPLGIRSFAAIPLLREGRWVSGLAVFADVPRTWTDRELLLLNTVAERTWSAIENLRLVAELQASEERYRTLFESIDQGFCVCELTVDEAGEAYDHRILEVNPAFEALTGLQQVTGKAASEVIPTLEPFWLETYACVVRTSEPTRFESYLQGLDRWFDVYVTPIGAPQDQKFAVLFSNITDRKLAEAQREQLLQREQTARETAENANRIKDEFLAVLSHELRSPLNPILGWTRLLQNGKLDETRRAEALRTIDRNAKLQAQLIEDLLDISRIMQGKLSLTVAPVNLPFVISAAIETVRLAAEAKNTQITLDLDEIPPIAGDAARLQQVVWNLLTNAVKFTPNGGQVMVELRQLDHLAQIRVIDTGKGIKPQFLPHVFEYFRQEDGSTTRKFGGLGLGLAIVRQIVEMHGGTVSVESEGENQGATFIVRLPLLGNRESGVGNGEQPANTSLPTPHSPLTGLQILLVDDETDTREFQAFALEQSGAQVTAVASGLEVLQALDQFTPDVLVSDIGMADMDGYMLIEQIRSRPLDQGGKIRAIALTAYAADVDQQKALQAGFQTHITKPVEPEVLVNAIVTLLRENRDSQP